MHYSLLSKRYSGLALSSDDQQTALHEHFGCTSQTMEQKEYSICSFPTPGIAIRAMSSASLVRCDPMAPPIVIQRGRNGYNYLHSIGLHDGLFTRDMFWAIPFYGQDTLELNNHWIYVVQHLMTLIGAPLVISGITQSEIDVNRNSTIIYQINDITCDHLMFSNCLENHLDWLLTEMLISSAFHASIKEYVNILAPIYDYPLISDAPWFNCNPNDVIINSISAPQLKSLVNNSTDISYRNNNYYRSMFTLNDICKAYNKVNWNYKYSTIENNDVMLVITFNTKTYDAIPFLEILYRPIFPHLVYCGPNYPNAQISSLYKFNFLSYENYIEQYSTAGSFNYICTVLAMKLNYGVSGYLVISDDLIISTRRMRHFPRESIWQLSPTAVILETISDATECTPYACSRKAKLWLVDFQTETAKALKKIRILGETHSLFSNATNRLMQFTDSELDVACEGVSDVYYVPSTKASAFVELAEIFYEKRVFVEIAVPTIMHCIAGLYEMFRFDGYYVWTIERFYPWRWFEIATGNPMMAFLHPVKLSRVSIDENITELFCEKILPFVHQN